ncbi:ATP-binding protein [Hoyosella subflava]|uniref:Putative transcriptional regulator, LuxR family n=1 Tax=Hoyosella subflava (strain DSM 45089 / JCM 17490 / NBRC 109087 / DQS3-9A1) TaxID=443218 RepID=F6ELV7_HOYSD|nr:AAA family ATPase [Hoyosella subflava]AEF42738.1 Putative transcriptional regulator, LuxR family [Hoyosella subflava DQS3-9A1]
MSSQVCLRLYEREHEQNALDGAFISAASGNGNAVFIIGSAGLGKTSLLRSAQIRNSRKAEAIYYQGHPVEASLPFAVLDRMFAGMTNALSAPPTDRLGTSEHSLLVHELALLELRTRADRPTVYLLDDLHWADSDSLRILTYLARRISDLPVSLIGAMRSWPPGASRMAETLNAQSEAALLRLEELTFSATHDLLGDLVGRVRAPQFVGRAYTLSGGNPLLVTEAARQVAASGTLPHASERTEGNLRQTLLLSHLSGLPSQSIVVAGASAVLGAQSRIRAVEELCGFAPDDFADAIDSLLATGVLTCEDDCLRFRHDLLAAALLDEMPKGRLRLLHTRAFEYYRSLQDPHSASAHAVAASMVGDKHAIDALKAVGNHALSTGAVGTAVHQLGHAVRFAGQHADTDLLVSYGDALLASGNAPDARTAYHDALRQLPEAGERMPLLARQAVATAYAGRLREALGLFELITQEFGTAVSAETGLEYAYTAWVLDGPNAGLDALARATAATEEHREYVGARMLCQLHTGRAVDLSQIEDLARETWRLGQPGSRTATVSFNPFLIVAVSYYMLERYTDAIEVAELGINYWTNANAPLYAAALRLTRMAALFSQGDLHALMRDAEEAAPEMSPLTEPYFWILRAGALIWSGHTEDAAQLLNQVPQMVGSEAFFVDAYLRDARGQLYLAAGDPASALHEYRALEEKCFRLGIGHAGLPAWVGNALEAYVAAGCPADVRRLVASLEESQQPGRQNRVAMVPQAGRAALAAAADEDRAAEEFYQSALALDVAAPLDRLRIRLRYGRWLRQRHRTKAARGILARALSDADAAGLHGLSTELHGELVAAGGRRRRSDTAAHLTTQQRRVAVLAVEGTTAREIARQLSVSVRTVESHLSAVYRTLGISSRAQLRTITQDGTIDLSVD